MHITKQATIKPRSSLRAPRIAAVSAIAMVGGIALAGPAPVAFAATPGPVYSELSFDQDVNTWTNSSCTASPETEIVSPATTLGDNGASTLSASRSQRFTGVAAVPDTMDVSVSQKATATSGARAGLPAELRLNFSGQAKAVTSQPESFCSGVAGADATLRFTFTTAKWLWATLSYSKSGSTTSEIYLHSTDRSAQHYEDLYGQLFKGSGSTTVLLKPGEYAGLLEGGTHLPQGTVSGSATGSATLRITFAEAGSAVAAPSGAATNYVSLPAIRSCATHNLTGRLTANAKSIRVMARVSFAVNGRTVKTLTGAQVRRGAIVRLPISDEAAASVRTIVKLKNGKTQAMGASYRACA